MCVCVCVRSRGTLTLVFSEGGAFRVSARNNTWSVNPLPSHFNAGLSKLFIEYFTINMYVHATRSHIHSQHRSNAVEANAPPFVERAIRPRSNAKTSRPPRRPSRSPPRAGTRHTDEIGYHRASGAFVVHATDSPAVPTKDVIQHGSTALVLLVAGLAIVPALACYLLTGILAESVPEQAVPPSSWDGWFELLCWLFSSDWVRLLRWRRLLAIFA